MKGGWGGWRCEARLRAVFCNTAVIDCEMSVCRGGGGGGFASACSPTSLGSEDSCSARVISRDTPNTGGINGQASPSTEACGSSLHSRLGAGDCKVPSHLTPSPGLNS
jgi:hypothetical protein